MVAKDIRSTTAKNISLLEKETGGLTWAASAKKIRDVLGSIEKNVPVQDAWRIPYIGNLLEERDRPVYLCEVESQEVARVQGFMDSLCTN